MTCETVTYMTLFSFSGEKHCMELSKEYLFLLWSLSAGRVGEVLLGQRGKAWGTGKNRVFILHRWHVNGVTTYYPSFCMGNSCRPNGWWLMSLQRLRGCSLAEEYAD